MAIEEVKIDEQAPTTAPVENITAEADSVAPIKVDMSKVGYTPIPTGLAPPPLPVQEPPSPHTMEEAQALANLSANAVGSEAQGKNVRIPATLQQLIEDTRSTEIAVQKAALFAISTNPDASIDLKIAASQGLNKLYDFEINMPHIVTSNAYVALASQDEDDATRIETIEDNANLGARSYEAALQAAPDAESVAEWSGLHSAQDGREALMFVYDTMNNRAKFLSSDFASLLVIPGEAQRGMSMIAFLDNPKMNALLEETGRAKGQVSYGYMLDEMGKILANESPKEQMRVAKKIRDWTREKNPINGSGNTWIEFAVVEGLLHQFTEGGDREGWNKLIPHLNSLNGIMDIALVGKWVSQVSRMGGRVVSAGFDMASRQAPKTMSKAVAKYLELTPDELLRMGIKDPNDLLNVSLPAHQAMLRNPNVSAEISNAVREVAIAQVGTHKALLNALEVHPTNLSEVRLSSGMESFLNRKGAVPQTALSTITAVGDNIDVTGRFGKADGHGYASQAEALAVSAKAFGSEAVVTPSIRHISTGVLVDATDPVYATFSKAALSPKTAKEYDHFVDVKSTTHFDEVYNIDDWVDATVIGQDTGKVARFLFDRSLTKATDRLWDNSVTSALAFHAGNKRHVQELFQDLVKPELNALSMKERASLNTVLFENAGKAELFTGAELASMGLSSTKAQTAYFSVRGAMDITHNIADRGLARSLRSEGFKILTDATGTRLGFGKEVGLGQMNIVDSITVRLVDDLGARPVSMSLAELDAMKKAGGSFYQMKFTEWVGDAEVAFTAVAKKQIPETISSIPSSGVLPKAAGYFPEITRAPLSVYGVSASGKKYMIATAENSKDALAYIGKAQLDPSLSKKYVSFGKEFFSGYKDALQQAGREHDIYENLHGVVYGHKGADDIINASGMGADYNKLDPLNAINSVFTLLANNYTKGTYIQHMESQLTKFATQHGLLSADALQSGRKVSHKSDLIVGSRKMGEEARMLKQAEQWIDTIDAYKLAPDAMVVLGTKIWKGLADLTAKSIPSLERFALKRAQNVKDPLAVLNGIFHFTNIITNPPRQFLMNTAQALTNLAHPVAFTKGFLMHKSGFTAALFMKRDLQAGLLGKANMEAGMAKIASEMRVSRAELDGMLDAYLQGGIYNQVSHNTVAKASAISEAEAQVMKDIARISDPNLMQGAVEKTSKFLGKSKDVLNQAGFALGEHENAMFTFLTLFNAHRADKAFDVTTDVGRKALAGKTMAWVGNMTPEGRVGFQKDGWKTMFQYVAFQYKMLMNVLPPFLGGSKMLTGAEKIKIALSQGILFGADAMFVGSSARRSFEKMFLYEEGLSEEERAERIAVYDESGLKGDLQYGLAGRYMNTMLQAINNTMRDETWDDNIDVLNFSEILGIGGGTDLIKDRAFALGSAFNPDNWTGSKAFKNALIVAGGTNGLKLNDWASWGFNAQKMLANVPPNWTAEQKVEMYKYVAEGSANRAVGMLDKYQLLRAEQHYNTHLSKGGMTHKPYNDYLRDRVATLFGITYATEAEYYESREFMTGRTQDKLTGATAERKEMINSNARGLYKYILEQARLIEGDSSSTYVEQVQERTRKSMEIIRHMLDDRDFQDTSQALNKLILEDMAGKNANSELMDRLLGVVISSEYGTDEGFDQVTNIMLMEHARDPRLANAINAWLEKHNDYLSLMKEEEQ